MSKEDQIELEGKIEEVHPSGQFTVLTDQGHRVQAHLAGKMRKFRIRVLRGDRVIVAVTPYDLNKGRIIYRSRN